MTEQMFEEIYNEAKLEEIFEGILKSSNASNHSEGIEPLISLVNLLKNFADTITHKTEGRTINRTMQDEQAYLNGLIQKIQETLNTLAHSTVPTVNQSLFDTIEDQIRMVLEQLNRIISAENEIYNNAYQNIVNNCQITIDQYLQGLYFQILQLPGTIVHKNGDALQQTDFCFDYYQNLYNINISEKIQKNEKTRELNSLDLGKTQDKK